ncbi:MAG: hypothetical protein NTW19_19230 [Planctomycetota bacterium]|nr:hypothetical protein [Planctomycetota bacterium]
MTEPKTRSRIYNGEGDRLMADMQEADRIILLPDARPSKVPDRTPRIRLMWGQHMLEDLLAGRYRSLVCAVNDTDNRRGIVTQLATLLPTSQWDERSITAHAKTFSQSGGRARVVKYDMDAVEVLAILRPAGQDHLTMEDLAGAFKVVVEMISARSERTPSASVSFLGARSNALRNGQGNEPSLETVLAMMYGAGFTGDVYPAPTMWEAAPTAVYARYPFPSSLESMRHGGS